MVAFNERLLKSYSRRPLTCDQRASFRQKLRYGMGALKVCIVSADLDALKTQVVLDRNIELLYSIWELVELIDPDSSDMVSDVAILADDRFAEWHQRRAA